MALKARVKPQTSDAASLNIGHPLAHSSPGTFSILTFSYIPQQLSPPRYRHASTSPRSLALGTSHGVPGGVEKTAIQRAQGCIQALIGMPEQAKATALRGRKGGEQKPFGGRRPAEEQMCYSMDPSRKHSSQCRGPTSCRAGRLEHLNQHWS